MAKLRLVKVLVQPVFVLVDGDDVTEIEHPPVAIPAAEWPTYSSERFSAEVKAWQAQLDADVGRSPSRATRRARKPKA
jgi:hypothetical protein